MNGGINKSLKQRDTSRLKTVMLRISVAVQKENSASVVVVASMPAGESVHTIFIFKCIQVL